jgi:hypothetical protein
MLPASLAPIRAIGLSMPLALVVRSFRAVTIANLLCKLEGRMIDGTTAS